MMERKQEMMQQKRDAGSIETRFPEVASIDMNMTYTQEGTRSIPSGPFISLPAAMLFS